MRKKAILKFVGVLSSLGSTGFAQGPASECTAIDDDLTRLACYDIALGRSPSFDTSPVPHWRISSTKSDFTDETDVFIVTHAEDPLQCSYDHTPALIVRCKEGETDVFVSHGCYAPPNPQTNKISVEMRIDNDPTDKKDLRTTTDDKGFGWWGYGPSMISLQQLLERQELVMRFQPYREAPQIVQFNITGLKDAMRSTNPSCNWKLLKLEG